MKNLIKGRNHQIVSIEMSERRIKEIKKDIDERYMRIPQIYFSEGTLIRENVSPKRVLMDYFYNDYSCILCYLAGKALRKNKNLINTNLDSLIHKADLSLYYVKDNCPQAENVNEEGVKYDLKRTYKMKGLSRENANNIAKTLRYGKFRKALRFLEVDLLS